MKIRLSRRIIALALAFVMVLGRITVLDKTRNALNGPASVKLDEIMYADTYTAEARIQWAKVTGASGYEIYKVNADGTKTLIMATPATAFYIPTLKCDAAEEDVTLEIVAINRNGVRGKGTRFTIDWLYGNDDSEEIVHQTFENVCLNATVTGVSFANSGEPASKALDGTSANNSKWCATNMSSGWMTIDIGREVTVKRWRVEYAEYFSSNGSWYFHIGADEYGNDAYSGSMGFPSMGAELYAKFAEFVNANAAIVEGYDMTARAWNDGIYYGSYTADTWQAVADALAEAIAAINEIKTGLPFVDVPADSFYYDPVVWALEKGITTGTDATHFSPDKVITRAQIVTFLYRAYD